MSSAIALLPWSAPVFVKGRATAALVANQNLPAHVQASGIGHEQISVVQLAPVIGGDFTFGVEPFLLSSRDVSLRAPLHDEVDLVDFNLVELPPRLNVCEIEHRC